MQLLSHIIEPQRLLVVWQTLQDNLEYRRGTGKRYIVGELVRLDDNIILRYFFNTQDFKDASSLEFKGFSIFDISQEMYDVNVMSTLERRIPSRQRTDFNDFLIYHRINPEMRDQLSNFALLGYTGGNLPGDGFSFIHTFEEASIPCELTIDVAGFSHYKEALPSSETLTGSSVIFKTEPQNSQDSEAIIIKTLDGKPIGYVNRAQKTTFNKWLKHHHINGTIERINGTTDRPNMLLYVKVT